MAKKLKDFNEVIGQTNIVKWFKSCIDRDKLPQVILLQGPAGIGKTTLAKIVACEIACKTAPSKLDEVKEAVIERNKSTDCVRLYNMSNLKSQEAVTEVKADLTIGFSSTGRKVIIMDEAHGMSDEAQDSLLTTFESLQEHVYVIVCSTELDEFRDAFLSRCVLRRLSNLSQTEMRKFLQNRIAENKLTFELPLPMVYSLISTYTGREPRRAINILDSFEESSLVTTSELETFLNVWEGKQLITLIDYLYSGNILLGLEFISGMDIGNTVQSVLLDILRVAQNGQSSLIDKDATLHIRNVVERNGLNNLLGFVIDCTTHQRLTRNMMSGFFLKWCHKFDDVVKRPETSYPETVNMQDIRTMNTTLENKDVEVYVNSDVSGMSLEMLMAGGESVD